MSATKHLFDMLRDSLPAQDRGALQELQFRHDEMLAALRECASWMADHGCVPPCLDRAHVAVAKATAP